MEDERFAELKSSMEDALAYASGLPTKGRVRVHDGTPDVKTLRTSLELSQHQFATVFGISMRTLQDWEQGRRTPQGPAVTLLRVIESDPNAVLDAVMPGRKAG